MEKTLFTIGHSTRPQEEFLALLRGHGIRQLIDVRSIPMSAHNPQYNKNHLSVFLRNRHINYSHAKDLGGRRRARKDSFNSGWRNLSFRGYADYMSTEEFTRALTKLMDKAKKKPTAIMCAEAVPWRCHRSLIADALSVNNWHVFHIQSAKTARKHKKTSFLKVHSGKLIYVQPA